MGVAGAADTERQDGIEVDLSPDQEITICRCLEFGQNSSNVSDTCLIETQANQEKLYFSV